MVELCWRPDCGVPVPPDSHSPWFCSVPCETRSILELRGETTEPSPDVVQAPPPRPLGRDGYGAVDWTPLSWWPGPRKTGASS